MDDHLRNIHPGVAGDDQRRNVTAVRVGPADAVRLPAVVEESHIRVFLDTEFLTGTDGPLFLSAAFLTCHGIELYAERPKEEVEALLQHHPNDFVREQVLSQFDRHESVQWAALPTELAKWLDRLGVEDVDMIYDYSNDYLLVEQLLAAHGAPLSTRLHPTHVGYLLDDADGNRAAESAWQALEFAKGLKRHHALADCYALRLRFDTVHPPVQRREPKIIVVNATVSVVVQEFEIVHAETDDQLTLAIGEGVPGLDWRTLVVGQRLRCVVQTGAGTRVLKADVLP